MFFTIFAGVSVIKLSFWTFLRHIDQYLEIFMKFLRCFCNFFGSSCIVFLIICPFERFIYKFRLKLKFFSHFFHGRFFLWHFFRKYTFWKSRAFVALLNRVFQFFGHVFETFTIILTFSWFEHFYFSAKTKFSVLFSHCFFYTNLYLMGHIF